MSDELPAFHGVLPGNRDALPTRVRSRGARRRAPPTEDVFKTVFTAPTSSRKKTKVSGKGTQSPGQKPPTFPLLDRRRNERRTDAVWAGLFAPGSSGASSSQQTPREATLLEVRDEPHITQDHLLKRLHASGIQRSHAQAMLFPVDGVGNNQVEDKVASNSRRSQIPACREETKPLVTPPFALHPASDAAFIPTRPLSSSSPGQRDLRAPVGSRTARPLLTTTQHESNAEEDIRLRKVPMTARDRFYLEQRVMTAPAYSSGHSPRITRPTLPISSNEPDSKPRLTAHSGTVQSLSAANSQHREGGTEEESGPRRRGDVLSGAKDFKTFTESIAEDLRRTSSNATSAPGVGVKSGHPSGTIAPESFLYLRRIDSNPYHLAVTSHTKIDPNNYYTVSRLGITHFAQSSSDFVALEKFEREKYIYSIMVKLPFFRKYRVWKRFALWKQVVNDRKKSHATLSLNQNLFLLLPHLHEALMRLQQLCVDLGRVQLFSCDSSGQPEVPDRAGSSIGQQSRTFTLSEFSIRLKAQKMECERIIDQFVAEVIMVAKNACELYLYTFLQDTGINEVKHKHDSSGIRGAKLDSVVVSKNHKRVSKPLSTSEALQTDQEMSYTERATMRTQCRKITKFLRVVEFLVSDALLRVAISSTEQLVLKMAKIKEGTVPTIEGSSTVSASQAAVNVALMARYKHTPLFRVDVSLQDSTLPADVNSSRAQPASRPRLTRRQSSSSNLSAYAMGISPAPPPPRVSHTPDQSIDLITYTPYQEHLRSQLETLVFNGLKAVTSRDRLMTNSNFKVYLDAGLDDGPGGDGGDDDGGDNNGDVSSETMDLDILIMEDLVFIENMQSLNVIVQEAYSRANASCMNLLPYLRKYFANIGFCNHIVDPKFVYGVDVEELRDLLEKYTMEIELFSALPDNTSCGLLLLDNSKLNAQLKPSPRKCLQELHAVIPLVIQFKNAKLMEELTSYNDRISAIPSSVDEYAEALAFLRELQDKKDEVEDQYSVLKSLYLLIEEFNVKIPDSDHTNAFLLSQRRAQLKTSMDLFENSCEHYTEKFGVELESRIPTLVGQLSLLTTALSHQKLFQLDSDPQEMVEYLGGVEYQFQDLENALDRHFFYEKTLALPHTNAFEDLADVETDLQLKTELWNGLLTWNALTKEWNPQHFPTGVDVSGISDEVSSFFTKILQWEAKLSPGTGPLCAYLKGQVESYRITMPILQDLKCASFEDRHDRELQALLGFSIRAVDRRAHISTASSSVSELDIDDLTLGRLVDMRLAPFADQVNRIATDAIQERLLKENLDKIIAVWERMEFEVRAYKDTKEYSILVAYEAVYATLEESLVSLTALLNSKYLAPIKDITNAWQKRLALFQETLDAWIECQRKWMHLETIFSAPDIQKQLPNEAMMFITVNLFWKDLMRKTREHRNCMKVSGAFPQGSGIVNNLLGSAVTSLAVQSPTTSNAHVGQISLLETFNRHNTSLDKVEKSLEDYLETKRGFFPRFFFISNDELLEILAHAKEPQSVQRHLCKCFDALVRLDISEDSAISSMGFAATASSPSVPPSTSSSHDILAMISPEGERVAFSRCVKARGNVEDWLNSVLNNMKITLQRCLKTCLLDYQHVPRESWLFRHPAQCVAVVSYIMWARECETCFKSASNDPLKELAIWHQTICSQLIDLTRLVRTSLNRVQRSLVVSLVTTDVHYRDVVEDLVSKKVTSASDFIWAQQLRYYWNGDHDECMTQQANFKTKYGYEYMGACSRLVITPLTDRCWMTITGALALGFGAAPSGPAGTGKTETSKDLAKALGVLCIVFNCSDQIDYKMMARIFNGALQSGSWACLDEFNRIDIEVLSVVAQQMSTIRHARLAGATSVVFEGKNVAMREHHIIITMNPGYVGRTELPDNLKVCFRPVAMMVPDYALIAEILLFAEGFQEAKMLSKKMTKLYKLCSEQLSQQPHYDFGMRAVKCVLLMAGALKRSASGTSCNESRTLIKAMEDANIPKFVDDDILLFHGLLRDLFPDELVLSTHEGGQPLGEYDTSSNPPGSINTITALSEEIDRQLTQHGYITATRWKQKILQLFETIDVRIGVVQIGASGSGKSAAFKVLKDAMTTLRDVRNHPEKRFQKVISFVLNPKSIAMNELYGFFHPQTREWTDGLASSILRQCITEKSEQMSNRPSGTVERGGAVAAADPGNYYWITFDGPIDALWIESMNTVLDDNMTLCLANGERIKLLPKIQMVFEVSDTSSASPATISRLGVVYYHPSYLGWRPMVESWVNALSIPVFAVPPSLSATSPTNDTIASFSLAVAMGYTTRLSTQLKSRILHCFDLFVEHGLSFVRSGNRSAVPTSDNTFVASICSLFETFLLRRGTPELFALLNAQPQAASAATTASVAATNAALGSQQNRVVDLTFVFGFIWAFGGNLLIDKWRNDFQDVVFRLAEQNEQFLSRDIFSVSGKVQTRVSRITDVFDFYVDYQHLSVVPWAVLQGTSERRASSPSHNGIIGNGHNLGSSVLSPLEFHPEMPLFQLIVPTTDMTKYSYLTQLMAIDGMSPVYLTGTTGAGKSVLVQYLLRKHSSAQQDTEGGTKKVVSIPISFSAQTSSLVTQLTIESKLIKKRKTLLGAPAESLAVIFIDDVNMPNVEAYGAQPPIELLRQYMEYRGVYDREKFFWKEICDSVLIATGGIPGGGRHALCERFMRQFSVVLCMPSSDETTMKSIFASIVLAHITSMCDQSETGSSPPKLLKDASMSMVDAAVGLYRVVSETLRPTPSKSYYLFNLRDVAKLMQGIVLGARSYGVESLSIDLLSKLWAHECIRVFRDRLMEEADKLWFSEQLVGLATRHLGLSWTLEHVHESSRDVSRNGSILGIASASSINLSPTILFSPLSITQGEKMARKHVTSYEQITDLASFEQRLDEVMKCFNREQAALSPPRLVFFKEAMIHVAAIARILVQPRGHGLLLGIAGSGKRSLARIACFMMGYHCYEIELTKNFGLAEFREVLRCTMTAAVLGKRARNGGGIDLEGIKPTVLLMSESQLISEQFVEDINTLLNGGEIPKLFSLEEYEKVLSEVRSLLSMKQAVRSSFTKHHSVTEGDFSRGDCETYFRAQVQKAMHVILCHSPESDVFRTRIRQFPSLVNCMTIDFFEPWPSHALQYVAVRFLQSGSSMTDDLGVGELTAPARHAVSVMCMEAHQLVVASTEDFFSRFRRHVYFTPKHFITLIGVFLRVYKEKQVAMAEKLTRLSVGVIKLEETNALVSTLQEELVALQPILRSKTIEAEQLLQQVNIDQQEAGRVATRVSQDEAVVKNQQREVAACQADAQNDLDQALPALNAAVHALDSLDKKDITEVKAFIKPPLAVQVVMEAVCIMLGEKADWDTSKRVLSRSTFMSELKEYDKDNINPAILRRIRKYIDNPDFAVEEVKKVSRAAMSLCMWVHAIDTYARVYKEVAPKRQRLAEMNEVLAEANTKLASKQQELAQVMGKVQSLKDQCDTTLAEKQRLLRESELTQARLQRAERLTIGLKDERIRWKESIEQLRLVGKAVLGDAFLAAASISYLGPFNGDFRARITRQLVASASRLVDVSPNFSFVDTYGDAMELREWELLGLPSDVVSRENALIILRGSHQRWPLLIDPQQQATQWIQRLETSNRLEKVKAQDRMLLQVLERTLADGAPLLIEDLNEHTVGQSLEPLLFKAFLPGPPSKDGREMMQIKLGEHVVPADAERFRLYLVTQIPNPHFVPDTFIRVNIINFTVTKDGLTEQLLADVVRRERVEVEERKHNLLYSITQDQKMLQQIEIKILSLLSESKGNILDDVELIQALETAKHTSRIVTQRLQESEVTKHQILQVRDQYQCVAVRGALLYFVIADLATIDSMYQYSLDYFRRLFTVSLEDAHPSSDLEGRLRNLQAHLTLVVYRNISRGLFEAHKLLFSAIICFRIGFLDGNVRNSEFQLLDESTIPSVGSNDGSAKKSGSEVDPIEALFALAARSDSYVTILDAYRNEPSAWTEWMTSMDPFVEPLPGHCNDTLTAFQRLVLVRWMRDDAWTTALRHYVEQALGDAQFVETTGTSTDSLSPMSAVYSDMDKLTPCLFILSSGADPMSLLTRFARERPGVYPDKYRNISLGQGQGPIAERLLETCTSEGHWLVLQNIHLAKSWIPRFEEVLGQLAKPEKRLDIHEDFRLFLTSFPVTYFPIGILQNSVKVTNEPPKGIKANLQRSMGLLEHTCLVDGTGTSGDCDETDRWISQVELQMVFGLSFFHAVVQERSKFGSLGWNLKYDFSDADFTSVVTLQRHLLLNMRADREDYVASLQRQRDNYDPDTSGLDQYEAYDSFGICDLLDFSDVPWDALHFLTGEIYYGGRVTDEFDRRCLMSNLQRFCSIHTVTAGASSPAVVAPSDVSVLATPNQLFSPLNGSFIAPVFASRDAMMALVDSLPTSMDAPYVFGMHPNANVFYLKHETQRLVSHVLQLHAIHSHEEAVAAEDADTIEEIVGEEDASPLPQKMRRQSSQLQERLVSERCASGVPTLIDNKPETIALHVARDIQQKLPWPSDVEGSSNIGDENELPNPFTVVLHQELAKCNGLLTVAHDGLRDLQSAIQGRLTMSTHLEQVLHSLWQHQVPLEWRKRDGASVATPTSTQSLASWVNHIRFRHEFFQQWLAAGRPPNGIFPLSVFCFPQGFFTAILQRHARKYLVPIHHLEFQFVVLREAFLMSRKHMLRRGYSTRTHSTAEYEAEVAKLSGDQADSSAGSQARRVSGVPGIQAQASFFDGMDGAFISGLHLEGAQWSDAMQCLVEPKPGVMHQAMPVIHVVPQVISQECITAVSLTTADSPSSFSASFSRSTGAPSSPGAAASRTKALTPSYLTLRSASVAAKSAFEASEQPASLPRKPSSALQSTPAGPATVVVTNRYVCPLYKTRARKGTLSTTGISTNFILAIELSCEKAPEHYALNGTALISNLAM